MSLTNQSAGRLYIKPWISESTSLTRFASDREASQKLVYVLIFLTNLDPKMAEPLIFLTGNPKKFEEFVAILGNSFPSKVTNLNIDLPELQGTSKEICIDKCKRAAEIVQGPVVIEDSSLNFNAMKGMPGPYIKWFLDSIGADGLFKMLSAFDDKSAVAICIFAYTSGPGQPVVLFQGQTTGKIVSPRGSQAFGWDSCFQPDGYNLTYAELSKDIKNQISQRYTALTLLRNHFINQSL